MKWIHEADFIMPLLTPNFLREIHSGTNGDETAPLMPVSPILNRYMYVLMRSRYTAENCRNTMVRPILPEEFVLAVKNSTAVAGDPIFRHVWMVMTGSEAPDNNERLILRVRAMLGQCKEKKRAHENDVHGGESQILPSV
jgi:hypothetical protein